MAADIRFIGDSVWVVCARCGLALDARGDLVLAEDLAAEHGHAAPVPDPVGDEPRQPILTGTAR